MVSMATVGLPGPLSSSDRLLRRGEMTPKNMPLPWDFGVYLNQLMDRSFLRQAWAAHGALNKNSRWVHPEDGWKSPWVSVVKYVLYTDPRAMRCLECLECLKTGDVFSMGDSHLRSLSHRFWSFPEWGMLRLLIFDKETNGEKGHPKSRSHTLVT